MDVGRRMNWIGAALLGVVLAIGVTVTGRCADATWGGGR